MKKRKQNRMSKYNSLWEYVRDNGNSSLKMTFEQIQQDCRNTNRPFFFGL